MNKSELKEKWGKYTNTDKLVDDIGALLTKYEHNNTEHGICIMLDTYFTNKEGLIKLISQSPNYAGDMRIVRHELFERENSDRDIRKFCQTFVTSNEYKNIILNSKDGQGKTMMDYLKVGVRNVKAKDLLNDDVIGKFSKISSSIGEFNSDGYTVVSANIYKRFTDIIKYGFGNIYHPNLTEADVKLLLDYYNEIKLASGMKTSRAFNRVCEQVGVTKTKSYNKLFAQYADMVSGLQRQLDFVISVNPYDYLTMSFGINWASCHTIDKANRRRMDNNYHGMYCGGTLSYMLDRTSIITYVVPKDGDVQNDGKIYRNMFHNNGYTFIQSRIYPQGNDGATDLYKKFRDIMQNEMFSLLKLEENRWTIGKGYSRCSDIAVSYGCHYRDYTNFSDCSVFYPYGKRDSVTEIEIGHDGICPNCGQTITYADRISHHSCSID